MGSVTVSFDADAMLSDQREVFDYWASLKNGRSLPRRKDFRPAAIVRRLPTVSLIEIGRDGACFRYRLAGTGLRETFGEDLTGRCLDDVPGIRDFAGWRAVCEGVATSAAPASGFMPLQLEGRPALVQAWLRLPLADENGRVSTILGYDRFLPVQRRVPRASNTLPSWDDAVGALARSVFPDRRALFGGVEAAMEAVDVGGHALQPLRCPLDLTDAGQKGEDVALLFAQRAADGGGHLVLDPCFSSPPDMAQRERIDFAFALDDGAAEQGCKA